MAHDRDPDLDQAPHHGGHALAALELDRVGAPLLDQPPRVPHPLLDAHLVGHERHVGDHQRGRPGARHRAGVVEHLLDRHREGGLVAQHDRAQAVPHQQDVDARFVGDARGREVVGGHDHDRVAAPLHLDDRGRRHLGPRRAGGVEPGVAAHVAPPASTGA